MEIKFADSFFDSVKKLVNRERWWWKTWDLFRHDIPNFFRNFWHFKKALWKHQWYDYRYPLEMFKTSLEMMEKGMHDGLEERSSRDKKIKKMQRAIWIMDNFIHDRFIDLAEKELGKEVMLSDWEFTPSEKHPGSFELIDDAPEVVENNRIIFNRSTGIENEQWDELWDIMRGQDVKEFKKGEDWDAWYDGSCLMRWWD